MNVDFVKVYIRSLGNEGEEKTLIMPAIDLPNKGDYVAFIEGANRSTGRLVREIRREYQLKGTATYLVAVHIFVE